MEIITTNQPISRKFSKDLIRYEDKHISKYLQSKEVWTGKQFDKYYLRAQKVAIEYTNRIAKTLGIDPYQYIEQSEAECQIFKTLDNTSIDMVLGGWEHDDKVEFSLQELESNNIKDLLNQAIESLLDDFISNEVFYRTGPKNHEAIFENKKSWLLWRIKRKYNRSIPEIFHPVASEFWASFYEKIQKGPIPQ